MAAGLELTEVPARAAVCILYDRNVRGRMVAFFRRVGPLHYVSHSKD